MVTAFLVLLPVALVVALMQLATWRQRGRLAEVTRQIAVTDAIHAELGPVVSPIVHRRLWGRWQLSIAVPFDDLDTVKRVVETASGAFNVSDRAKPGRFELVLSPQEQPGRHPTRAAAAGLTKGESASWI